MSSFDMLDAAERRGSQSQSRSSFGSINNFQHGGKKKRNSRLPDLDDNESDSQMLDTDYDEESAPEELSSENEEDGVNLGIVLQPSLTEVGDQEQQECVHCYSGNDSCSVQ